MLSGVLAGPRVTLSAFEQVSQHAHPIYALKLDATIFLVPYDEHLEGDVQ